LPFPFPNRACFDASISCNPSFAALSLLSGISSLARWKFTSSNAFSIGFINPFFSEILFLRGLVAVKLFCGVLESRSVQLPLFLVCTSAFAISDFLVSNLFFARQCEALRLIEFAFLLTLSPVACSLIL
jgi:hypothetical protein